MKGTDPVFPVAEDRKVAADIDWAAGITKRELFAAMAMQAYLTRLQHATTDVGFSEGGEPYPPDVAEWAVRAADALIAELAKERK